MYWWKLTHFNSISNSLLYYWLPLPKVYWAKKVLKINTIEPITSKYYIGKIIRDIQSDRPFWWESKLFVGLTIVPSVLIFPSQSLPTPTPQLWSPSQFGHTVCLKLGCHWFPDNCFIKGFIFIHKGLIENLQSLSKPGVNADANGAVRTLRSEALPAGESSWRIFTGL